MWVLLAILSALCLGLYDINKKRALTSYSVVTVLTFSLLVASAILVVPLVYSIVGVRMLELPCIDLFYVPEVPARTHVFILIKSCLVLSSWLCAYTAVKYLPLSLVAPLQATRPMWTLLGAVTIFSEQLSALQWIGIVLALASITTFGWSSAHGKKDITAVGLLPVLALCASILLGASSGLYDKFMMRRFDHNAVQVYYILYQSLLMWPIYFVHLRHRSSSTATVSSSSTTIKRNSNTKLAVALIAVFLVLSDYVYLVALSDPSSMIAVVSTIRRSGMLIPFLYGLIVLRESYSKRKLLAVLGILLGLICLCLSSL